MEDLADNDMGTETVPGSKQSARPMNAFLLFCKRHRAIVKVSVYFCCCSVTCLQTHFTLITNKGCPEKTYAVCNELKL